MSSDNWNTGSQQGWQWKDHCSAGEFQPCFYFSLPQTTSALDPISRHSTLPLSLQPQKSEQGWGQEDFGTDSASVKNKFTVKWCSLPWVKQAANYEVCYNPELPLVESATMWKKKFKNSGKLSKFDYFSRQDIKFIHIFKTLIEFSPICSHELYISYAFWRCVEHLDTHFPFISHWSFKNSILWNAVQPIYLKWQGRAFSLQYLEHIYFTFSLCCLLQFPKGGLSLMLAVFQIHGKHSLQEQTLLGCKMALCISMW